VQRQLCLESAKVSLKHSYQSKQLNFMMGTLAMEEDYVIEGPVTEPAILELLTAEKDKELQDLYSNWNVDSDV
jgi:hypothetical protein